MVVRQRLHLHGDTLVTDTARDSGTCERDVHYEIAPLPHARVNRALIQDGKAGRDGPLLQ